MYWCWDLVVLFNSCCFLHLLIKYVSVILLFKIVKTERIFAEERISYEHEIFYYKYNEDLGGWIKEDRLYTIDAKEVKKELNKPECKTRSPRTLCRVVFLFFVYFKCCSDFLLYFYKCSTSMAFT